MMPPNSWPRITGTSTGQDFALIRYHTDGSLDNGFGVGGKVTTAINSFGASELIYAIALQPVDGVRGLSLAGDGLLPRVGVVANELDRDHAVSVSGAEAARRRSATNSLGSEASSQPARGPLG